MLGNLNKCRKLEKNVVANIYKCQLKICPENEKELYCRREHKRRDTRFLYYPKVSRLRWRAPNFCSNIALQPH